jgi:uncharacterized protein (TIGR04168 family)
MAMDNLITIAIVGDIHDQWSEIDHHLLRTLGVDLVLFVGDFGNEVVPLVALIADLSIPKAAILGNHDAWFTAMPWGRNKAPYDHRVEDRVQQQLDLLGTAHVGYSRREFADFGLTVVGGRPFSWGGPGWKEETAMFYRLRYGINTMAESSDLITKQAIAAETDTLIFLAHNGPSGLGAEPHGICGKDWKPTKKSFLGGDFGDPDLASAIAQVRNYGKRIPFVTFGHMHHHLRHTKERERIKLMQDDHGTLYINAACVPRIKEIDGDLCHGFTLVTMAGDRVQAVKLTWANPHIGIKHQENLYCAGG